MKSRFNKILSVLLVLIMLVSAVPLSASAELSDNVEFSVIQLTKDGNVITAAIDLASGSFNSIDLAFETEGLVCQSIEKGDFDEASEALFASNPASNATNNIAIASFEGVAPGNLAVVTIEVIDDAYSFNVKATACEALEDDETVAVDPVITSDVSGFEHRYSAVVTPPTCTHRGYTTYTCPCGEKYKGDYVDSTGHSFTDWISVNEPDCVNYGFEYRYCLNCGDEETRSPEPNGRHSYKSVVTAPTCTEQGYTTYTCHCGESYVGDYVGSTGHTPGEWTVTVPATSVSNGTKVLTCADCPTVLETHSIPKFGSVSAVVIDDFSMQYKTTSALVPAIVADSGVEYTVTYSSSDPSVASVDENGNVNASGTGSAEITCTVTDENGNVVTDTATVEVKYVWWQWIIIILLFGWIWY